MKPKLHLLTLLVCALFQTLLFCGSSRAMTCEELRKAIVRGDVQSLRSVSDLGQQISACQDSFELHKLLAVNAYHNNYPMVDLLVRLDVCDKDGLSWPLDAATTRGNEKIVKLLLENGADPFKTFSLGRNQSGPPVCSIRSAEVLQVYLDAGVDLKSLSCPQMDMSSLLLSTMLPEGSDALQSPPDSAALASARTIPLLHVFALSGAKLVAAMADAGADIGVVDSDGFNVYHYLAEAPSWYPPDAVYQKYQNTNARTQTGWTPLKSAVLAGNFPYTKWLLTHGPGIDDADEDGNTPLHIAVQHEKVNLFGLLMDKGASLTVANKQGKTPADLAKQNPHIWKLYRENIEYRLKVQSSTGGSAK